MRIVLVIILLVSIIFLGGAFLLPDKQFFTETRIIKTDPVAVFSVLEEPSFLETLVGEFISASQLEIEIEEKIAYAEISYIVSLESMRNPILAGFALNEKNEGTEFIAYIRIDSLQYPFERWKGFFIPFIHRKDFIKIIDKLERNLVN
ncbi:MAG: hypothetical protein ACOCZL_04085 [Bacteroidota bacterium]